MISRACALPCEGKYSVRKIYKRIMIKPHAILSAHLADTACALRSRCALCHEVGGAVFKTQWFVTRCTGRQNKKKKLVRANSALQREIREAQQRAIAVTLLKRHLA